MAHTRFTGIACLAAAALGACEAHDLGQSCPQLLDGQPASQAGGTRIETLEVVEQNASFPCQDLICVASDGRAGYCSRKCREDAGCPPGFVCEQVQVLGEFAGDKFCVWRRCERPKDCGAEDDFKCCHPSSPEVCGGKAPGLAAATGEEIKLCTFRE